MFEIKGRNMELTRGNMAYFGVTSENDDKSLYEFQVDDVVTIKVYEKGKPENVVLVKDFKVTETTTEVDIILHADETKIGELIKKPKEYWYEIELNADTQNTITIVGYDKDEGPAILWLLPEGGDANDQA